jgi:microcystin-dependent protein
MTKYIGPKTDGENVATQADVGGSALSDATPDALTPDQAGAAGTATLASRADHAHEIICAAAGAILPDDSAAEGTAASFARSDHTHAISAATAGTITGTNAEGSSNSFARADHNHALGTGVVASTQLASSVSEFLVPTGAIMGWGSFTLPTGWLGCDGSNISRTTYADLFAVIGTTYGVGNGSTTFGVPNLVGRVPVGWSFTDAEFDSLGETGGAKTHTLTEAQIPAHGHTTHATQAANTTATGGQNRLTTLAGTAGTNTGTTSNTGGGGSHNNLQPYIVLNYIIKI